MTFPSLLHRIKGFLNLIEMVNVPSGCAFSIIIINPYEPWGSFYGVHQRVIIAARSHRIGGIPDAVTITVTARIIIPVISYAAVPVVCAGVVCIDTVSHEIVVVDDIAIGTLRIDSVAKIVHKLAVEYLI